MAVIFISVVVCVIPAGPLESIRIAIAVVPYNLRASHGPRIHECMSCSLSWHTLGKCRPLFHFTVVRLIKSHTGSWDMRYVFVTALRKLQFLVKPHSVTSLHISRLCVHVLDSDCACMCWTREGSHIKYHRTGKRCHCIANIYRMVKEVYDEWYYHCNQRINS